MKLLISLSRLVEKVSITSYDAWIRPVRIIVPIKISRSWVVGKVHAWVRSQLNELFSPIKEHCANKIKQRGRNNNITRNSGTDNHGKNVKCKNVSPSELGHLPDTYHRGLVNRHFLFSILHLQRNTKMIKKIIKILILPGFLNRKGPEFFKLIAYRST